eukprot:COSAG01_NODE_52118_length_349_cov_0.620000_1_plen_57_part_01
MPSATKQTVIIPISARQLVLTYTSSNGCGGARGAHRSVTGRADRQAGPRVSGSIPPR